MAGVGGSASVNGSILIISVGAATTDQDADKANSNGGSNSSTNASSDAAKMGQSAMDAGLWPEDRQQEAATSM